MSTSSTPLPERAIFPSEPIYGLTVENYHDMISAGVFADDERVELLEGALVCKMSKKPPHVLATELVHRALFSLIGDGYFLSKQDPITLGDSEPEPDAMIVVGDIRNYSERHPGPTECPVVVEVADSSLRIDRGIKLRVYARASVSVYWVVNLVDRAVEVYSDPDSVSATPFYRSMISYRAGDSAPVTVFGSTIGYIAVDDVLP